MKEQQFTDLSSYLSLVADANNKDVILFRGQSSDQPLLPKIARKNPRYDSENMERNMLDELLRRGDMYINNSVIDDWDLLVHAQHYGMATRLLDWTSNPLVAIWFSCIYAKSNQNSFVYVLTVKRGYLLNRRDDPDPFKTGRTRVFKPKMNNNRIIAQRGWFTAHKYARDTERFVPLEKNENLKDSIMKIEISHQFHQNIVNHLNILGINYHTMFPDMEGLCQYINWLHE